MLTLEIQHQEEYSRGELLLRTFLGWLYMGIPHAFLLFFYSIIMCFMGFASFFIILFTGVTPKWYYEWVVKLVRWQVRLTARLYNLADGYPAFGMDASDDKSTFDLEPWQIGRGDMLVRTFFGWIYVGFPHIFALYVRFIATAFYMLINFFSVLFTGKYGIDAHRFVTGTIRWNMRLTLYLMWLYKDYPPFAGRADNDSDAPKALDQV